ncbi:hypothetical protein H0H92_000780, partial [Tricholoma furcatifolium]
FSTTTTLLPPRAVTIRGYAMRTTTMKAMKGTTTRTRSPILDTARDQVIIFALGAPCVLGGNLLRIASRITE